MDAYCTNCGASVAGGSFCTSHGARMEPLPGDEPSPTAQAPVAGLGPQGSHPQLPSRHPRLWPLGAGAAAIFLVGGGLGASFLVSAHSTTPTSVATAFIGDVNDGNFQGPEQLVDPDDRPTDLTHLSLMRFREMTTLDVSGTVHTAGHAVTGTHAWVRVRVTERRAPLPGHLQARHRLLRQQPGPVMLRDYLDRRDNFQAGGKRPGVLPERAVLDLWGHSPADGPRHRPHELLGASSSGRQLASWAQDETTSCTTTTVPQDPNYQATTGTDQQATVDKKAFVALWNPVAKNFNLTTYQWTQI